MKLISWNIDSINAALLGHQQGPKKREVFSIRLQIGTRM